MGNQSLSGLNDTSAEAEAILIGLLREASVWRKLQLMEELNQTARNLMRSDLRHQFPLADDAALRRKMAARILGNELCAQIWGDDV
jgi:hypothetical protein